MTHIILLLYLLAGVSGVGSMIYLITKYGGKSRYIQAYIGLHLSYTLLILAALVILYLRVNVIRSAMVMSIFVAVILLGQGFLCKAISQFSFIAYDSKKKKSIFWDMLPFLYAALAGLHILWRDTFFAIYPVIFGVILVFAISLWFSRRNYRTSKKQNREDRRVWILFLLFTIVVISVEITLKIFTGFLGEYSLNIPVIFLFWNFLSLSQLNKQFGTIGASPAISPESISKWQLTPREVEICQSVLRGDSNKEIASNLKISFSTVKNHIYNIYKKTGADSRVDLLNLLK